MPLTLSDSESADMIQISSLPTMSASFKSPPALTPGTQYFLVLSVATTNSNNYYRVAVDNKNPYLGGVMIFGGSNHNGLDALATLIFSQPTITILSPNGGENYKIGDTVQIKWNSTNLPANAPIDIELKDTRYTGDIAQAVSAITQTTNTGGYSWVIPSALNQYMTFGAGNVYKIIL